MTSSTTARPIDAVSRAYLLAGLRLGEDIDGFVDAYYGPPELRAAAIQLSTEQALDELEGTVDGLSDGPRRDFLATQARAMRAVAGVRVGGTLPYRDEVEATFGVRPERIDEAEFEAAQAELDQLLPGSRSLTERRQAYRARFHVATERLLPIAEALATDLRERTHAVLALPPGEAAHIELVRDKPWSGYNWYLGGYRSRIEINADLPSHINTLPDLIAHEMYCGHHTEHSVKEQRFLHANGWGEAAIVLLTSPHAIISEGIATVAFEALVPASEQADWLRRNTYDPAGIDVDIALDQAIQRASRPLRYVNGNAALLTHEEGRSTDEVVEYLMRYGLRSRDDALQSLRFIQTPILRCYTFTYTAGYDLVAAYLERADDRNQALNALISEHWTPARLRDET